jgi:putative copper resistance protein D
VESGSWDVAAAAAKALTYAGIFGAAGLIFFAHTHRDLLREPQRRALRTRIILTLLLGLAAAALRIAFTSASMSGDWSGAFDPAFVRMLLGTGEGPANLARLLGLVLAASVLLRDPAAAAGQGPGFTALLGAVLAATSFAWVGHTHAMHGSSWLVAVLCLHLLCVAYWWGALPALLVVAHGADLATMAAAAARFGRTALMLVAVLIAAGIVLLALLLDDVGALWRSDYGRMVVIKLGLVAALLAAAALNKLSLTPGLRRAGNIAARVAALRALRRSIRVEMALLLGIFMITAAFTTLTGPPGD